MQNFVGVILPFVLMLVIFYVLVLVPENRRKKKYNNMLNSLVLNDEIMTKGGIIGKITNIQDDFIIVQSGPDRTRIKLSKNGILEVTKSANTSTPEK
ncbi:preprotein translocase subunit YajC [Clostridium oryzae]|uniref:Preprotein translocase subunit YajC n=1 Tax=Clostridium oryzae TaxID=1450648 RepID=A0A1V4IU61_9CLOT|nr:preprotein translocase subunit YajC [Clostridium oryzae]OPJ63578.1 preprotein translocase subunit YajC [Clostridium oryzae]